MSRSEGDSLSDTPIGAIRSDWEIGVIGDFVATLQAGVSVNAIETDVGCSDGEIGVLKTSAVLRGKFLPEQHKVVIPEDVKRVATSVVGDRIIISRMNTPALVGESGYVAEDVPNLFLPDRLWQTEPAVRPHSQRWLSYWLQHPSLRQLIAASATGTSNSMKNISKETVLSLPIPRTPFPEQQKIAAILTAVDDKLDVIARQIAATKTLKQGLMQTLFSRGVGTQDNNGCWVPHIEFKDSELGDIPVSWSASSLGNEVKSIIGGGTPSKDVPEYWGGDIPWASVKDFVATRLSRTEDYITPKAITDSSTNLIPAGTLITPTRMALGRVAFFDCDVAINQDLKAIFPKNSLEKEFLFYWFQLNSEKIVAAGTGSTVKGIRLEHLREFDLALPPIHEQQKIVAILVANDEKLLMLDNKASRYKTLKRGLMQKLLTGEWRVKVETVAV